MPRHGMNSMGAAALALATLLAVSCKSSDDNSSTGTQSATGVWSGTDSTSGLGLTAIINSAGDATFIRSDGVQFDGTVQVSSTSLVATVTGYTEFPSAFSDGSTYGIGTLSDGTVNTGSLLDATLNFTTNANTEFTGEWELTYNAYSGSTSSLTAIANSYTDTVSGSVLTINSSGVLTEQYTNDCVLNGSITTNDSTHNVYEVAYTLESCTGTLAPLNGVQFTGLATLNNSVSPNQLIIAVSGSNSTSKYGLVWTLNVS
jgi:hypothetical protein